MWCKELTHLKRPWCLERLKAGGEGDDRGWDGWMASPTQWTLVWVNSGSWWWTGKPGVLQSMGSQRVRHNWVTELNWCSYLFFLEDVLKFFPFNIFLPENIPSQAFEQNWFTRQMITYIFWFQVALNTCSSWRCTDLEDSAKTPLYSVRRQAVL